MSKVKKIAILTSGGDSPGMNKAIASLAELATINNIKTYVVINGYKGLYENNIREAAINLLLSNSNQAGSCILCSRFPEFKNDDVTKKCADNLKEKGIDVLFVLGGNGSYAGAKKLIKYGINVICLPCTIDNDISGTEFTIGFDSALNACVNTIDTLRATSDTHGNIMLVEIMGRKCSDLTIAASFATSVDYIITPYNIKSPKEIVEVIKKIKNIPHKKSALLLITELIYTGKKNEQISLADLREYVEKELKMPTKTHVIGFVQRGAHPTAMERYNASKIARYALQLAIDGKFNIAVGISGPNMVITSMDENFDRSENNENAMKAISIINKIDS